jgi:hypothetical protein
MTPLTFTFRQVKVKTVIIMIIKVIIITIATRFHQGWNFQVACDEHALEPNLQHHTAHPMFYQGKNFVFPLFPFTNPGIY